MRNIGDMQYFLNITIGSQIFRAVPDTGSFELVVLSSKCSSACGTPSTLYTANQSINYRAGVRSVTLQYGSGLLLGHEAYDNISVGPFRSSSLAAFWEVVDANMPLLLRNSFQVIFGLGPIPADVKILSPEQSENGYAVLLENLNLSRSQYSICLGQQSGSPGYLTWNDGIPETLPQAFTSLRVEPSGYWMVNMKNLRIGDRVVACKSGCGAILDSGTSLLSAPSSIKEDIKMLVASMTAGCFSVLTLPRLYFELDDHQFSLAPDAFLARMTGEDPDKLFEAPSAGCQVAMLDVQMKSNLGDVFILGMPFFREYYTVFHQRTATEPPKVSVAQATDQCLATMPSAKASFDSQGRRPAVRHLDASKIHIAPWVQNARITGHLQETGTRHLLPQGKSQHGALWKQKSTQERSGVHAPVERILREMSTRA